MTTIEEYTYLWDFGDGNTSTEMQPRHTYAEHGTYRCVLTYTNIVTNETKTFERDVIYIKPYRLLPKEPSFFLPEITGTTLDQPDDAPRIQVDRDPVSGTITFTDVTPPGTLDTNLTEQKWVVQSGTQGDGLPDVQVTQSNDGRSITVDENSVSGEAVTVRRYAYDNSDPAKPRVSSDLTIPVGENYSEPSTGDKNGDGVSDDYRIVPSFDYDTKVADDDPDLYKVLCYDLTYEQTPENKRYSVTFEGPDSRTRGPYGEGGATLYLLPPGIYRVTITSTDSETMETFSTSKEVQVPKGDLPDFTAEFESEIRSSNEGRFVQLTNVADEPIAGVAVREWSVIREQTEIDPDQEGVNDDTIDRVVISTGVDEVVQYEVNNVTTEVYTFYQTVTDTLGEEVTYADTVTVQGLQDFSSPTADFEWEKKGNDTFDDVRTIVFKNRSKKGTTNAVGFTVLVYLWSFGDGTFSRKKNPEHTYPQSNTPYRVTLFVTELEIDETLLDGDAAVATNKGLGMFDTVTKVVDTGEVVDGYGPIPSFDVEVEDKDEPQIISFKDRSRVAPLNNPDEVMNVPYRSEVQRTKNSKLAGNFPDSRKGNNQRGTVTSPSTPFSDALGPVPIQPIPLPSGGTFVSEEQQAATQANYLTLLEQNRWWKGIEKWFYEYNDGTGATYDLPIDYDRQLWSLGVQRNVNELPPWYEIGFDHQFPEIAEDAAPTFGNTYNVKLTVTDLYDRSNAIFRPVTVVDVRPRIRISAEIRGAGVWEFTDDSVVNVNSNATFLRKSTYSFPSYPGLQRQVFLFRTGTPSAIITLPSPAATNMRIELEDNLGKKVVDVLQLPNSLPDPV